jgi:LPS export ABC transporter protein LptC
MVSIRNFTRISYKSDGSLEWTLDAGESFVYPVEDRTILYDLIFRQFEEGKLKSSLEGKRGEVNHTNKELIIKGSIHLVTEDKKELFTEELNYNLETKELKSDTDVKILSGGTIIEGRGLRAEKELNRFTILKPKAITRDGIIPFQSK